MHIKVVIVTQQRCHEVERCLNSLVQAIDLSPPTHQILLHVLINGPDLETTKQLADIAQSRTDIHILSSPTTLKPGLARNTVLKNILADTNSGSDWVLFLDDDAYIAPNFFRVFAQELQNQPSAVLMGGPNVTPPDSSLFQYLNGAILASVWGTLHIKARYCPTGLTRIAREADLSSCVLFVRIHILRAIQFPADYRTGEETLLLTQILKQWGPDCYYSPALSVFHDRRRTVKDYAKQIFGYGAGRARVIHSGYRVSLLHYLPSLGICFFQLFAVYWFMQSSMLLRTDDSHLSGAYLGQYVTALSLAYLCINLFFTAYHVMCDGAKMCWLFFLYPLTHIAYGFGFISQFLRKSCHPNTSKKQIAHIVRH